MLVTSELIVAVASPVGYSYVPSSPFVMTTWYSPVVSKLTSVPIERS